MRLTDRSFPHPVVGNADDVPGAEFQATFDFTSDPTNFYLKTTVRCSSKAVQRLIERGKACYSVHVECSNTLYRRTFDFDADEHRETIPATLIHAALEVNAFVRAKAAVPKYAVDGAHTDYEGMTFAISPGDILAVGNGVCFDAEHDIDPMRRVGALMDITWSKSNEDHPMEFEPGYDKIHILLCKSDFEAYSEMKNVPDLTSHLTTTLVLPVLMEAIAIVESGDAPETRWANRLKARLEAMNLGGGKTALDKAQALLNLPIRRALESSKSFLNRHSL